MAEKGRLLSIDELWESPVASLTSSISEDRGFYAFMNFGDKSGRPVPMAKDSLWPICPAIPIKKEVLKAIAPEIDFESTGQWEKVKFVRPIKCESTARPYTTAVKELRENKTPESLDEFHFFKADAEYVWLVPCKSLCNLSWHTEYSYKEVRQYEACSVYGTEDYQKQFISKIPESYEEATISGEVETISQLVIDGFTKTAQKIAIGAEAKVEKRVFKTTAKTKEGKSWAEIIAEKTKGLEVVLPNMTPLEQMRRMVTLRDEIAREQGKSVSTVGKHLKNKDFGVASSIFVADPKKIQKGMSLRNS